jgi:hypothetical protein
VVLCTVKNEIKRSVCVCLVAVGRVIWVFISAVCGVLYKCVCVGTGGLCSPGFGRGVCSGGLWWRFKVWGVVCVCDQGVCVYDQVVCVCDQGVCVCDHVVCVCVCVCL